MQVIVDSLLTSYLSFGGSKDTKTGACVLLLHGWADSSAGWQQFASDLSSPERQVVVVDLPGFGGTQAPGSDWGLDEYAAFIASFIAKLRLTPTSVVGHSNGGAIAIRGLAGGQFSTKRLILLASAGVRGQQRGRNAVLRSVAKAGKALGRPLPAGMRSGLHRRLYAAAGSDMLVAEHMSGSFKRVVGDDVQADAAKLDLPVLLIYGEDDQATPVAFGRMLHRAIPGSRLEVVERAGHFLHQDQPQRLKRAIEDFLA